MRNFISYLAATIVLFSTSIYSPCYSAGAKPIKDLVDVPMVPCYSFKREVFRLDQLHIRTALKIKGYRDQISIIIRSKLNCSITDIACHIKNKSIDLKTTPLETKINYLEGIISVIEKEQLHAHKELVACLEKELETESQDDLLTNETKDRN